jgi:hypothetical protein
VGAAALHEVCRRETRGRTIGRREGAPNVPQNIEHQNIEQRLQVLHDEYTVAVNNAVAEGRDDIVERLVAEFPDAALRLMSEHEAAPAGRDEDQR